MTGEEEVDTDEDTDEETDEYTDEETDEDTDEDDDLPPVINHLRLSLQVSLLGGLYLGLQSQGHFGILHRINLRRRKMFFLCFY